MRPTPRRRRQPWKKQPTFCSRPPKNPLPLRPACPRRMRLLPAMSLLRCPSRVGPPIRADVCAGPLGQPHSLSRQRSSLSAGGFSPGGRLPPSMRPPPPLSLLWPPSRRCQRRRLPPGRLRRRSPRLQPPSTRRRPPRCPSRPGSSPRPRSSRCCVGRPGLGAIKSAWTGRRILRRCFPLPNTSLDGTIFSSKRSSTRQPAIIH